MALRRLLVTADDQTRLALWLPLATVANWIEGRPHPRRPGVETWSVTVFDPDTDLLLEAARRAGATVEEIDGADDDETYRLLVGTAGSGWAAASPGGPTTG